MGMDVAPERSPEAIRRFTRALLRDLQAMERILAEGMIESGIRRFGAEQEMFLVDEALAGRARGRRGARGHRRRPLHHRAGPLQPGGEPVATRPGGFLLLGHERRSSTGMSTG